jgi:hypothetical protein
VDVSVGMCLTIPLGTQFQFRAAGEEPLLAIGVTMRRGGSGRWTLGPNRPSWLSRTPSRLPREVHDPAFTWALERLAAHGLIKGERIGVGASSMEASAALRTLVRRDSGKGYREMLSRRHAPGLVAAGTTYRSAI